MSRALLHSRDSFSSYLNHASCFPFLHDPVSICPFHFTNMSSSLHCFLCPYDCYTLRSLLLTAGQDLKLLTSAIYVTSHFTLIRLIVFQFSKFPIYFKRELASTKTTCAQRTIVAIVVCLPIPRHKRLQSFVYNLFPVS